MKNLKGFVAALIIASFTMAVQAQSKMDSKDSKMAMKSDTSKMMKDKMAKKKMMKKKMMKKDSTSKM